MRPFAHWAVQELVLLTVHTAVSAGKIRQALVMLTAHHDIEHLPCHARFCPVIR
jgi:hypothetical protein